MILEIQRGLLTALSPGGSRARLLVLTFHQVPAVVDSLNDVPDASLFERQMSWLREYCHVLSLPDAARRLAAGTLPARAACITFDDGYANNLEVAAPILRRLGLHATFFIAGGAVDEGIMWNDLVIEGVRRAPAELDLTALGLGRFATGNSDAQRAAIAALLPRLKYAPIDERWRAADGVFAASAGADAPRPRLMMTREQVAELARQGFDVGAHTINHPILKELTDDAARREIVESAAWVRLVTGTAPVSFAYPNGRPGVDYTTVHASMVSEAGFEVAVSTAWGCATRASSLFELPRFSPWERFRDRFWLRLGKTLVRSYVS